MRTNAVQAADTGTVQTVQGSLFSEALRRMDSWQEIPVQDNGRSTSRIRGLLLD